MPDLGRQLNSNTRSAATIDALIAAGITLFGEKGYDATSTRDLCQLSKVNVSGIAYHFKSKQGLYCAVIDYIGSQFKDSAQEALTPVVAKIEAGLSFTNREALDSLKAILTAFARVIVENENASLFARIVVREQANPSPAFDLLYDKYFEPIQRVICFLVAVILDESPSSDSAKIRTHTLFGQVLGFVVSKESLYRNLGCERLNSSHRQLIYSILQDNVEALCANRSFRD